jgi:hypothetical protein
MFAANGDFDPAGGRATRFPLLSGVKAPGKERQAISGAPQGVRCSESGGPQSA